MQSVHCIKQLSSEMVHNIAKQAMKTWFQYDCQILQCGSHIRNNMQPIYFNRVTQTLPDTAPLNLMHPNCNGLMKNNNRQS